MKYIVLKYTQSKDFPAKEDILFCPETINHKDFAKSLVRLYYTQLSCLSVTTVSAGFCNINAECFGKSETLKLSARKQDSALILKMQYNMNFIEDEK